eukprot:TRINITY_DN1901_c0_g1_i1.p1 TRINITY_DN1901_c0_g1~~TRINITY_DN1901_c0_g1_i1.p1  ORF type:complete len:241 (+),score=59.61 TRINITY_DN1901_c0_g1_i1:213-935(+)
MMNIFQPIIENLESDLFVNNASQKISESIRKAISDEKIILLGLSGGSCAQLYDKFIQCFSDEEWKQIIIYLVDERFVPPNHYDSNVKLVKETLVNHVNPLKFIYPSIIYGKSLNDTCKQYGNELQQIFNQYGKEKLFIVNILGMGPDYHIASLFPPLSEKWLSNHNNDSSFFIPSYTEKFAVSRRISSSISWLNLANQTYLILNSIKKRELFDLMMEQSFNPKDFPIETVETPLIVYIPL